VRYLFLRSDGEYHRLVLGAGVPREALFRDGQQKADWLDASASLDAATVWVRRLAQSIAGGARSREEIAARLLAWVRDRIGYLPDPGHKEEFADPKTVAISGYDDCDGKARLYVALIRSLRDPRLRARIRPIVNADGEFYHVQAEVRWDRKPWCLAETIVAGVGLGGDPDLARESSGRIPMAGPHVRLPPFLLHFQWSRPAAGVGVARSPAGWSAEGRRP
jgi:Transglutaminase-like superfamily